MNFRFKAKLLWKWFTSSPPLTTELISVTTAVSNEDVLPEFVIRNTLLDFGPTDLDPWSERIFVKYKYMGSAIYDMYFDPNEEQIYPPSCCKQHVRPILDIGSTIVEVYNGDDDVTNKVLCWAGPDFKFHGRFDPRSLDIERNSPWGRFDHKLLGPATKPYIFSFADGEEKELQY